MLVKFTLPSDNGIAQAIPAHIYLTGPLPHAKIDTTCVFWKDAEEIAEHEILASHQAINLRLDTLSESSSSAGDIVHDESDARREDYCSFPSEQIPHL